ncbi:hypothetical protein MAR_016778 [Mya arenaria]|uniref:Uncharacterized protein n=1 Tax=Mya arenaria TaxID=6604 RepID=A0ABY7ECR0_MYAAR|nr:hypothetical protein MAR_016778 [Mya arenaria]
MNTKIKVLITYFCLPCAICNISTRAGECMCMAWCVTGGLIALRARIRTLGGIQMGAYMRMPWFVTNGLMAPLPKEGQSDPYRLH